jgi:hypothetical protein
MGFSFFALKRSARVDLYARSQWAPTIMSGTHTAARYVTTRRPAIKTMKPLGPGIVGQGQHERLGHDPAADVSTKTGTMGAANRYLKKGGQKPPARRASCDGHRTSRKISNGARAAKSESLITKPNHVIMESFSLTLQQLEEIRYHFCT